MFQTKKVNSVEIVDTDPNLYVRRAEDSLKRREYQEALREMDDAIKYASANHKAKYAFEKIKIFDAIGQHPESIDFIKKYLVKLYGELPLNQFYRVLRVLKNNSKSDLSSLLQQNGIPPILLQVYQSGKASEYFFKEKAREYLNQRQYVNALGCTDVIMGTYGTDSETCLIKAQVYKAQGSYTTALDHYFTAANHRNPQLAVFTEIADVQVKLNRQQEAVKWVDKGLSAYPLNSELLHLKADLLYNSNKYDECMDVLDTTLEKYPQDAKAFYMKGLIYDHQKKYPSAKRFYNKAEALNSNYKAPVNSDRERFLSRMKMLIITVITVVVLLVIGQFVMYTTGMAKPIVHGATIETDDILFVGETMQVYENYGLYPSYAKKPDIKYRIVNPDIAQITEQGEIKGLKVGSTAVQLVEGNKVLDSYHFIVKPQVKSLTMDASKKDMVIGETAHLSAEAKMNYDDAKAPEITYTSNHPSIVSVNQEGEIEAKGIGEAIIKAHAGKKTVSIKIHSYTKVDEILLDLPEDVKLQVGKKLTLKPTVKTTPENGKFYPLDYETSDSSIATVNSDGEVTGVSAGEVEIVITSLNGVEKRIKILVTENLQLGKPGDLKAELDEGNQTIHLSWSYDDSYTNDEVHFKVSEGIDNGSYNELDTIKDTSLDIPVPSEGTEIWLRVEASSGENTSEAAVTSVSIPYSFRDNDSVNSNGTGNSDGSNGTGSSEGSGETGTSDSQSTNESGTSANTAPAKTPEEIQKDKDVANLVKLMTSVEGYWKNVNPDNSDYRDIKYAVIGNDSSESRENSFKVYYLAQSYYSTLVSSYWEYGLRHDWIKLEGSKLYDTDGDAITIVNPNKFILEFKDGFHGDVNKKTFTYVRCNRSDISSDYLKNTSLNP